jgi:2-methylisocitrate lyase-like PEP mutase family enzyme
VRARSSLETLTQDELEEAVIGSEAMAPIRDFDDAVRRIEAAATAAHGQIVLTGRTDNFLWGISDIDDTIHRLSAYAEAGADVLYAPSLPDMASISAVIKVVAPKPVNVLVSPQDTATLADLQTIGVRRVSLGVDPYTRSYTGGCGEASGGRPDGARIRAQLRPHHRSHQGLTRPRNRPAAHSPHAARSPRELL